MVTYRTVSPDDAPYLWEFLIALDSQTRYMVLEPGEREIRGGIEALRSVLEQCVTGISFIEIAEKDESVVGFIRADRGHYNRTRHTAHVTFGVREGNRGEGIGKTFLTDLESWARKEGVIRLELTIECRNKAAIYLCESCGFSIEGTRRNSMAVDGHYLDEVYMAKLL